MVRRPVRVFKQPAAVASSLEHARHRQLSVKQALRGFESHVARLWGPFCSHGLIGFSRGSVAILLRCALYLVATPSALSEALCREARAPAMLEEHLELNSPITSHLRSLAFRAWGCDMRLKEGLFLLENGVSPYAGDTCPELR